LVERKGRAKEIHLQVVDHQVGGRQRIDTLGVSCRRDIALRMAAKSTTAGTPVKSWSSTRGQKRELSDHQAVRLPGGQLHHIILRGRALHARRITFSNKTRTVTGSFSRSTPACSAMAGGE
jgi:hypothetical protein